MKDHPPSLRNARKFPRYRCNHSVRIRYRANNSEQIVFGRCIMVSKGGIGALVGAELAIGQVVYLELAIPTNTGSRALKAQVKNRNRSSYGFQFIEADPRSITILLPLFDPKALLPTTAMQNAGR